MRLGDFNINPSNFVPKSARKAFERTGLSSLLGQTVFMVFLFVVYVAVLVALKELIPDVLEGLKSAVGPMAYYSFAAVPFVVVLVFSTLPTVFRARRQYQLSRRKFAWKAGSGELFRLHPYGAADRDEYKRPGGEHDKAGQLAHGHAPLGKLSLRSVRRWQVVASSSQPPAPAGKSGMAHRSGCVSTRTRLNGSAKLYFRFRI